MKWGIAFSSTGFPDPDVAVAMAQTAEEAGFESLWAPEHVIMSRAPDATPYRGMPDGKMDRFSPRWARCGATMSPHSRASSCSSIGSSVGLGRSVDQSRCMSGAHPTRPSGGSQRG